MRSGIYKIYNAITGKSYIGSSQNLKRRLKDHKVYLKNNTHPSTHLQASYNKYGKDVWEFDIIEYCEINMLKEREEFWMQSIPIEKRYNQRLTVESNRGTKWSDENKLKLKGRAAWNKGVTGLHKPVHSIKKGDRISKGTEFKKGCSPWNKNTKGLSKANKGSFGFGSKANRYGKVSSICKKTEFIPHSFGHISEVKTA